MEHFIIVEHISYSTGTSRISWSTTYVSRSSGDIFREVNHVMALLRQLRRYCSRQVLQILINSKSLLLV